MASNRNKPTSLPKILIISSAEVPETIALNDALVRHLNERLRGICELEWHNYHDLGLEIAQGKLEAFVVNGRRPLTAFKAAYFKSYFRYHEQATAIAEALKEQGVRYVGKELERYIPAYKLSQLARLSRAGLPVPHTLYMATEQYLQNLALLQSELGEQFIFKAIDGSTGEDNYLVKNREQLEHIVAQNPERHFIAQKFIANDSDMRVLILDDKIRLVIERRRKDNTTHLNNTSQGAAATLHPNEYLNQELQTLCLQAASIMNRDVAGVDLMLERGSGRPYILEVNASPQIASGAFEAEKLAMLTQYFTDLAGK